MSTERTVTIVNELGLHARPASKIAQLAGRYAAELTITHNGQSVNAKSVLGLLTLAAPRGAELRLHGEGSDAAEGIQALAALIASGFDE